MKTFYTLDCEFNGLGGQLLSMAVYSPKKSIYLVSGLLRPPWAPEVTLLDPWVLENVAPFTFQTPPSVQTIFFDSPTDLSGHLERFFAGTHPAISTDWPDDIKYFCEALITGPGTMIDIPGITFEVHRVDCYPTTINGAVRHNAWWDACILYDMLLRSTMKELFDTDQMQ